MSAKIEVILAHSYKEHDPGDQATFPTDEADKLVRAGYARYATKADAQASVAGDPNDAAQTATAKPDTKSSKTSKQ